MVEQSSFNLHLQAKRSTTRTHESTLRIADFFQSFEEWLEQQSFNGNLPELGEKKTSISIETLNSGYLYDMNGENAKYRIECRLIYTQEV